MSKETVRNYKRPDWCGGEECPRFRKTSCELQTIIYRYWESKEGRDREMERMASQAKTDPQAVIERCQTIDTRHPRFRIIRKM
ncbi:hypothetical protein HY407_03180 [Candidatus Gottesmanbacteria bacterium]|nr:hypothetical protein [Candidatus Gottesmanbacteria bacterium]